jgi:hypothetical protein
MGGQQTIDVVEWREDQRNFKSLFSDVCEQASL